MFLRKCVGESLRTFWILSLGPVHSYVIVFHISPRDYSTFSTHPLIKSFLCANIFFIEQNYRVLSRLTDRGLSTGHTMPARHARPGGGTFSVNNRRRASARHASVQKTGYVLVRSENECNASRSIAAIDNRVAKIDLEMVGLVLGNNVHCICIGSQMTA